jgi:hypothetical protein
MTLSRRHIKHDLVESPNVESSAGDRSYTEHLASSLVPFTGEPSPLLDIVFSLQHLGVGCWTMDGLVPLTASG